MTLYDAGYYASHIDLSDSATGPVNVNALAADTQVCTGAVADGATKVLLSYNPGSAGTVVFTEMNGVSGDNLRPVTSLNPTNQMNQSVSVTTQVINGQNIAYALYTVPESLDTTPEYVLSHLTDHRVNFQAVFTPAGGTTQPAVNAHLGLQSPPVLLVHGLFSGPSTWLQDNGTLTCLQNGGFLVYPVDYSNTHAASLAANRFVLLLNPDGIEQVETNYRSAGIAITKVDVVGHSMGGLITREFASDDSYKSISNFHSGYVRRFITMGTPHYGSGLDSAVTNLALHTRNGDLIYLYLATSGYTDYGALLDLSTGSNALAVLKQVPIPSYAEVGLYTDGYSGSSYISVLHDILLLLGDSTDAFNGAPNDLLVSDYSQEGGLVFPYYNPVSGISHVQEPGSDGIGQDVAFRLAGPLDLFDPNGFPVPQAQSRARTALVPALKAALSPASTPFLTITAPTAGQVFQPGDTVTVAVAPNAGTTLRGVLITVGAGSKMVGSSLVSQSPFTASFTIPASSLGSLPINVLATDTSGNACIVSANAIVQTSATASSLTVAAAQVAPSGAALLTSQGSTNPLTVTGTFSDGVQRDVTLGVLGTTYTSSDPTIATVSANGVLTAVANGTVTITITNGSVSATENVLVQLGTPSIFSTAPSSAAPGATVSLALTGTDFGGASQVQFLLNGAPDPNVTASGIQVDSPGNNLTAGVTLAPGAAPGLRTVVVTTPGGSSDALAAPDAAGFAVLAPTTTTLASSSVNPSVWYQPITFTITVAGNIAATAPTGTVTATLTDPNGGSIPLGVFAIDSTGSVQVPWAGGATTSGVGNYTLTAAYSGDGTYPASTGTLVQIVDQAQTAITLAASSANPTFGQAINLTATPVPVAPSTESPNGKNVQFFDSGSPIGNALTTNGIAVLAISTLNPGVHSLTASWAGGFNRAISTSNVVTVNVSVAPTTTTLTSSLNPSVVGQSVTFTAAVTGASGTPTGTVTFTLDGTAQVPVPLTAGQATLTTSTLTQGTHQIIAVYSGDSASSQSPTLPQTVTALPGTTLSVSSITGIIGQTVTLSAMLKLTGGAGLSGKTLAFAAGGSPVGTVVTGSNGVATLAYGIPAGTAVGSHTITASFAGDSTDQATSGTGTLTVSAPPPVGQVRFFPRAGYPQRMVGGKFQSSHDNLTWTTLATVTQTPSTTQYSTLPTTADPATFRYLRYLAPNSSYGNVAEVEFDSHGTKLKGTAFGTAGSYNNSGNTYLKVLDGNTGTFFDAPSPGSGDYVGIDQGQTTPVLQIDAGGGAAGTFSADADYSTSSRTSSTLATVSTAGVTNPAPQAVYQSERYGNFSYILPSLTPGASYTLRLHFAEIYWNAAGKRLFSVSVNGSSVLSNFDIFAAAGGENKAVVRNFPVTADSSGKVTVVFTTIKDNAKLSGLELLD